MEGYRFASAKKSRRLQRIFACVIAIVTVTIYGYYQEYLSNRKDVIVNIMLYEADTTSSRTFIERTITDFTTHQPRDECHIVHEKLNSCNKLPNFFLYEDQRHHFQNSIINFWHIQKASGSTVGHCLVNINKKLKLPPTAHGGSSCKRKEELILNANYFKSADGHPVIRGHGTLGLCDFIKEKITNRKCSTFTVFRDPYDRLVSHYFFNRQVEKRKTTESNMQPSLNNTIKDWIKGSAGSIAWRAFSNEWEFVRAQDGKEKCQELHRRVTLEQKWPPINQHLADIASNLDKHLSFIGLTEDLPMTYRMLEEVYGLPFVNVCSDMHVLQGSYESVNVTEQRALKMAAKRQIMEDPEIQRLIQFEVLMYEKAKEIFEAQKRVFLEMKGLKR